MIDKGDVIKIRSQEFVVCAVHWGRKWITLDLTYRNTTKLATFKYKTNSSEPFTVIGKDPNTGTLGEVKHNEIDTKRREAGFKRKDEWHEKLANNYDVIHSGKKLVAIVRYARYGLQPRPLFRLTDSGCYVIESDMKAHYVSGRFVERFDYANI